MAKDDMPARRATSATSSKRSERWEKRYQRKSAEDFCWYLEEPPAQLIDLVQSGTLPQGAAVDIGCGPGVATKFLAGSFAPTVGLDIALAAVQQARGRLTGDGAHRATFVVAEAPFLPLKSDAFALVFDRGCLQAVPREGWETYFEEATRLLKAGGVLQIFVSKPMKSFPPLFSYKGVRSRLRWLAGRRGPQFLNHDLLTRLAGSRLEVVRMDDFPFKPSAGPERAMTHAIFKKR